MKTCWLRQSLLLILVLFACAGFGVEGTGAKAVLQASGNVQVNGNASRRTTTLFSGDVVETDEGSAANIIAGGSSVLVLSGTAMKFLGNGVELTQGGMAIATSEAMTATVDGLTITPAAQKFSKFEVAEDDDTVVIAARQGNVAVSDGQQTSTVPEGQETKRKKKEKGRRRNSRGKRPRDFWEDSRHHRRSSRWHCSGYSDCRKRQTEMPECLRQQEVRVPQKDGQCRRV